MSTLPQILFIVSGLVLLISFIWMVVLAFQRSFLWGLALLFPWILIVLLRATAPGLIAQSPFLIPSLEALGLAIDLAFLIIAWQVARRPFFWSLAGVVIAVMAIFSLPGNQFNIDQFTARNQAGKMSMPEFLEKFRSMVANGNGGISPADQKRGDAAENPATAFRSKLPAPTVPPGQPEPPSPGIFYLMERVTVSTPNGVKAAHPGEKVTLIRRMPGDRMEVTVGNADFIVKNSQVTDDLNAARALEKQDFEAHGGRL